MKVACSRIHLSKYHVIKCHREFSFSPCNENSKHHLVAKNHMDPGMFLFVLPPLHENDDNNVHEERTVTIMRMRLKTIVEIMPVLTCIAPVPWMMSDDNDAHKNDNNNNRTTTIRLKMIVEKMPVLTCIAPSPWTTTTMRLKTMVEIMPPPLERNRHHDEWWMMTTMPMKTTMTKRRRKTWYSPTPLPLNEGGTTVGTPPVEGQAHSQLLQPQTHSHPKLIF